MKFLEVDVSRTAVKLARRRDLSGVRNQLNLDVDAAVKDAKVGGLDDRSRRTEVDRVARELLVAPDGLTRPRLKITIKAGVAEAGRKPAPARRPPEEDAGGAAER